VRFKLDENLPDALAVDLRCAGQDADTVADEDLAGAPDPLVVAAALRERRILLTLDKGIANLTEHPASTHAGVVLFRPGELDRPEVLRFIRSRLTELLSRELEDRLTVVSAQRIRGR
jgi:predicted nuclease of predicted toxin-antitoxin system